MLAAFNLKTQKLSNPRAVVLFTTKRKPYTRWFTVRRWLLLYLCNCIYNIMALYFSLYTVMRLYLHFEKRVTGFERGHQSVGPALWTPPIESRFRCSLRDKCVVLESPDVLTIRTSFISLYSVEYHLSATPCCGRSSDHLLNSNSPLSPSSLSWC